MLLTTMLAAVAAIAAVAGPAMADDSAIPVHVSFTGTGTYSIAQHYVSPGGDPSCTSADSTDTASVSFASQWATTIAGAGAPLSGNLTGTAADPLGSFVFHDSYNPGCPSGPYDCSGALHNISIPQHAAGADPILSATPTGGASGPSQLEADATGSLAPDLSTLSSCADGGMLTDDYSVLDDQLPKVLRATGVLVPAGALATGSYTVNVTSSNAAAQMPADCTGLPGHVVSPPSTSCTASLTWSGQVQVSLEKCTDASAQIASATDAATGQPLSDQQRSDAGIPQGSLLHGQSIHAGAGHGIDIKFADGGELRLTANSTLEVEDCNLTDAADPSLKERLKLLLGNVWVHVVQAAQGGDPMTMDTETATSGTRGTTYEVSYDPRTQTSTYHLIDGRITVTNRNGVAHTLTLTPGETVTQVANSAPAVASGTQGSVTTAQLQRLLLAALVPAGSGARVRAVLRLHGYAVAFSAPEAGRLTLAWYFVPPRAHLAAAKAVLVASGSLTFAARRTAKLKLTLSAQGTRLLRKARRIVLTGRGTFVPRGQRSVTATRRVTLVS